MGSPDTTLQAGDLIDGRYRVNSLLGVGGMATVWAGTNERTGKRVALKVIRRDLTSMPGAELLFHLEALAASRVNHPNVVTVFDVVEDKGVACIVMELLDGEPLGTYIARNGPLGVGEATSLLVPAMRGVAAAHAQGVIHRDLKPQNIFICIGPDGRVVTTKVLDFGISTMVKRVRDLSAGSVAALAGTPSYMSPEQLEGGTESDERTDVYGFGVLLYEALSGKTPFPGEPDSELIHRILTEPPPPLAELRPDLPPGLLRIVETAMARNPDHRYSDMNVMVCAIEDETMPPTLPPRSLTPRTVAPISSLISPPSGYGSGVVQAIPEREQTGEHQGTRFLFGRVIESKEPSGATPVEDNTDWDRRLKAMASLLPPPVAVAAQAVATSLTVVPDYVSTGFPPSEIGTAPPEPRRRRGWIAAGVVIALCVVVWIVMPGPSTPEPAATPTAAKATAAKAAAAAPEPVVPPTAPASIPPAITPPAPVAAQSDPVVSPSAPAKSMKPAKSKDAVRGRSERPSRRASRARAALRQTSKVTAPERQVVRGAAPTIAPAPKAGASTKPAALRAGRLSADDF